MMMPVLLLGIITFVNHNSSSITGNALLGVNPENCGITPFCSSSNVLGTYKLLPSFNAKADYPLQEEYKSLKTKLKGMIDSCAGASDMKRCVDIQSAAAGWNCAGQEEAAGILGDFIDRLNECSSLEDSKAVCKFSIDERKWLNTQKSIRKFQIKLSDEFGRIKAELMEDGKLIQAIEPQYPDIDKLEYTDYEGRDTISNELSQVIIYLEYREEKPSVTKITGTDKDSKEVKLSSALMFYKSGDEVKFIDDSYEASFRAPVPANNFVRLPRKNGLALCAKTGRKITAFGSSDGISKERDIIYKFSVVLPKAPPKPIEDLKAKEALKSENSAIIAWSENNDNVKSYNIYYSKKKFDETSVSDIKKDDEIKKITLPADIYAKIDRINIDRCNFGPIGKPCKYGDYNNPIEKNKLYYIKPNTPEKGKFVYTVSGLEDGAEYNFAVTAVDDLNREIENDRTVKDNPYVFWLGNYVSFTPTDGLAPGYIKNLQGISSAGKFSLSWEAPSENLDGSKISDMKGFTIYYKKKPFIPRFGGETIDDSFLKLPVGTASANCNGMCQYSINIPKDTYYFAVVASDKSDNDILKFGLQPEIKEIEVS